MNKRPNSRQDGGPKAAGGDIAARLGRAVAHHQAGRFREAEQEYRTVLTADPHHADALHLFGVLALQVGQPAPAAELIGRAIQHADGIADYHDNLGSALAALGRFDEAAQAHARAIALNPESAQARHNLGNAHQARNMPGLAMLAFTSAVALRPDYAKAWYNLGNAMRAQQRTADAVRALEHAVALAPGMVEAHNNLGDALTAVGRLDEALAQHRIVVQLRPNEPNAHYNLGAILQHKGAYEGAEIAYREALKRDPNHFIALNNLGGVLQKLNRPEQAELCYRKALDLHPDFAEAIYNLGNTLQAQGRLTQAKVCYEEALARKPDLASATYNLALLALLHGQMERGWVGYEGRFAAGQAIPNRTIEAPRWQGETLKGRRLLIWREQGVGDEFQFASCYGDVIAWGGGPVTIETDPRLVGLFARSFPRAAIRAQSCTPMVAETIVPPDCDAQIPAGSLPRLLRGSLAEFAPQGPWLVPDPARVAVWRERLEALGPGLKVGIGWRSQLMTEERKAAYTTLGQWGPVFAVPGAVFVNLQYGDCEAELAAAEARFGVRIHRWADLDLKDDFEAAAALTANLDLVLSPAMSAGELAGALGVPVWRFGWRDWTQLGTAARPWYPSMRLFQPRPGETFDGVLARIALGLRNLAAAPAAQPASPVDEAEAFLTEAMHLHRQGRLAEAETAYRRVLDRQPDHGDALHLLGLAAHQRGDHDAAEAHIAAALRRDPEFPSAWNHLGLVFQAQDRPDRAKGAFARAVALRPDFPEALTHLGLSLKGRDGAAEAKRWHRRSIALAPTNPAAHANLGHAYETAGGFDEAAEHYRKALALRPDAPDAHNNLGSMAKLKGRNADSLRHLRRALRLDPGFALAAWNRGLLNLESGDLAAGWAGYERRFSARQLQRARRIPLPVWTGEPLNGRRLLAWSEQGLGDEILFASCFGDLAEPADGGRVVLECDRRLVPLFARAFPWATVRAETVDALGREIIDPPDCDLQIPAGSLPALRRPTLDRFPVRRAYLTADPDRARIWRGRMDAIGPGLKVGIAWRSQVVTAHREASYTHLEEWRPVLDIPGVHAVNLQYGDCAAEIAALEGGGPRRLHRWDDLDLKNDLEDVAALMTCLDLVIVPATAAGELAGALGVPVWRLGISDWTQLGSRARPWFSSMRLFQPRFGESLGDVVGNVALLLAHWAKAA